MPPATNMAMATVDRVSEYLACMPPEAVSLFAVGTQRACDALRARLRTMGHYERVVQLALSAEVAAVVVVAALGAASASGCCRWN